MLLHLAQTTQGARPSTQQRDFFQQEEREHRPTEAGTEALDWIMGKTLHQMWDVFKLQLCHRGLTVPGVAQ